MPLNIDFLQVLLHMLNFVILAGGLTFLLFKPINKFLENRKAHFEKLERDNAESAETNAKAKAEYEQKLSNAEAEIAEMKQNAEKDMASAAEGYINDAKDKASTLLKAAETEAENRKQHILDAAQTEIGELVISAAQSSSATQSPRSGTANSMMRSSALPKTIRGTNPRRAPVKAKKQAYPPTTPQAGKNNEHNRP